MDGAMDYEILLRRCYQCGRNYDKGADADIYRRYNRKKTLYEGQKDAITNNEPPIRSPSLGALESDMALALRTVSSNVERALKFAIREHTHILTEYQIQQLHWCRGEVSIPRPTNIDGIIAKADEILLSVGLYPK